MLIGVLRDLGTLPFGLGRRIEFYGAVLDRYCWRILSDTLSPPYPPILGDLLISGYVGLLHWTLFRQQYPVSRDFNRQARRGRRPYL